MIQIPGFAVAYTSWIQKVRYDNHVIKSRTPMYFFVTTLFRFVPMFEVKECPWYKDLCRQQTPFVGLTVQQQSVFQDLPGHGGRVVKQEFGGNASDMIGDVD